MNVYISEVTGFALNMDGAFRMIAKFQMTSPKIRKSGIYLARPATPYTAKIKAKASRFKK